MAGAAKKSKVLKRVFSGIATILVILLTSLMAYKVYIHVKTPTEFMIKSENYFDYQRAYECSGYASAYAIRSLGEDVNGLELYEGFTNKNPDGTVAPGFLWENLRVAGYKSSLLIGDLSDLKYHVSRGVPVVVLIRLNTVQTYLHYVPVVGYDEKYIYVADSLSYMVNAENENYNRKISIEEFEKLWKTETFVVNNIYLTIDRK